MRKKIIRLSTILTILLGMIFIFGLGFYSFSSTPDANLTVKEASGKAGTTNNLVSIEVTSNIDVRGIQFTLKADPDDVLIPTTVSLNPLPVSEVSIDKQDYLGAGLSVIIKSDSGIIIPAGGKQKIDILYNVAANTPDMKVSLALIDVKLADNTVDVNPITTTVSNSYFSIRSPETIPPTISGPYTGSCMYSELVDGKSFASNVVMYWYHSDNSGPEGIDTNTVRVWCIDPQDISHDLTLTSVTSSGGSFIFPASDLILEGWYKIYISVSDVAGNPRTVTATVKVPKSDTCKPTIYRGPYYTIASCHGGYSVPVNGATFTKDETIYWWQSDDSGGLCLDSGIDKATGKVEITGPNGYYENLTLSATITEDWGQVVFPASRLANGDYTIKINVCDKKSPSPNCANEVTALVHVQKSTTPPTPTNLKVDSVTSSSITWSWNAVPGATSYDYVVYTGGTCSSTRSSGSTSNTTLTVTGLSSSTTYSLKVRACNSSGCSAWSSCLPGTTSGGIPAIPTNLRVTDYTSSSITWSWDAVPGATSYYYGVYTGSTCSTAKGSGSSGSNTYHLETGLSSGTSYSFRVLAKNSAGDSAWSSCVPGTTSGGIPATPPNVWILNITSSSITWSWNAVSGATSYSYVVYNGGTCSSSRSSGSTSNTTITTTGLSSNTTYSFRVKACNSAGCSDLTSCVAGTTIPATPPNLRVTNTTSSSITWSWDAVSGAASYNFYVYNGGTCSTSRSSGSTSNTTITITGLSSSTAYSFKVKACNSGGCSDLSSCVAGTTK